MFLASVILDIFVYVELRYQNLTMTPLEGSAHEENFVGQANNLKSVLQVLLKCFTTLQCLYLFSYCFIISLQGGAEKIFQKGRLNLQIWQTTDGLKLEYQYVGGSRQTKYCFKF